MKGYACNVQWSNGTFAAWKGTTPPAPCRPITLNTANVQHTLHSCCDMLKRACWCFSITLFVGWSSLQRSRASQWFVSCPMTPKFYQCEIFSGEILPCLHQDDLHRKPSHLYSKAFIIMLGEHNDRGCKNKQRRKWTFKVGQGVVALEKLSFIRLRGCRIKMQRVNRRLSWIILLPSFVLT